jgi:hypothetical protein
MDDLPESARFEGLEVDLLFEGDRPGFGDLFTICGYANPNFPPSGRFDFKRFEELQFSQVDDYFGVQTLSGEGDDVAMWLYPLVKDEAVHHHPGPFDGLRLSYNVLRNPIERSEHFLKTIEVLTEYLPVRQVYRAQSGGIDQIRKDIEDIAAYWSEQGITVGTGDALTVDY